MAMEEIERGVQININILPISMALTLLTQCIHK